MDATDNSPPSCPDCGEPMAVRTAKQGSNAGNQFWGCTQYPECTGTRTIGGQPGEDDPGSEADDKPECPDCGRTMQLRTAQRGKRAGEQFWGCSAYPDCRGTRPFEEEKGGTAVSEPVDRSLHGSLRRAVTWHDGTLSRSGWTGRYTSIGGSLRALPEGEEIAASLSQCWIAVSPDRTEKASGPTPFTRAMRKMLQRGSSPPIHPTSERRLFEDLDWAGEVRESSLPGDIGLDPSSSLPTPVMSESRFWTRGAFTPSDELRFDSAEEETFYCDWVPDHLGPSAGRWILPQAPLDTLLRGHGKPGKGARRVDFLVAAPWLTTFVVEIDGAQHQEAEKVDDDRDDQLREIGLPVLRVPASEIRAGHGPALDRLRQRWRNPPQGSVSAHERLALVPAQLHRLAYAITDGFERGFLSGDQWVIKVHDEVGATLDFFGPYLDLLAAFDVIWTAEIMPTQVVLGDGESWRVYRRTGSSYDHVATARHNAEADDVDLEIRLESGKAATDALPDPKAGDQPRIVVRSARLPVRLSVAESVGAVRSLPDVPEGEEGDRALRTILRAVFAKREFREGQLAGIRQIFAGYDCAVLLPTGAGKSLIYQLAGLCIPGVTLIVDPIVSLMEDQLQSLAQFGVDRTLSITAHEIQKGHRDVLMQSVASGEASFVFVAPERLQQQEFRGAVRAAAQKSPINFVVIDEAHCVSEWGHDFRTSYLNLGRVLRNVARDERNESPPILALTGTASRAILNDMLVELDLDPGIPGTVIKPESFDRPELNFSVVRVEPGEALPTLRGKLADLPTRFLEDEANFFRPRGRETKSGIVFCPHVNGDHGVVKVAETITETLGVPAITYSGSSPKGISSERWEYRKRENARDFRENEAPLLVSTKAFGMGIDKPNIRYVMHYGMPGSIEAYYQEAGRAGRDRNQAECILVLIEFDEDRARRLLSEEASLEEMREERAEIPWRSKDDISRQLYFHLNSFPGVDDELATLESVLGDLGKLGRRREEVVFEKEGDDREDRERALHRLVILGVARDYLVDWGARTFDVELRTIGSDEVVDNALEYVRRTQPGRLQSERERFQPFREMDLRTTILRSAEELIRFIYATIERSRRRSLREMWLAARKSAEKDTADFRQRILEYLTEGELVPQLEELAERDEFSFDDWISLYEGIVNAEEARELRGSAGRLLSSFPDHPGLLAARAVSEMETPGGDLREIESNLDDAVGSAVERYGSSEEELERFGEWLLERFSSLSDEGALTAIIATLDQYRIADEAVQRIQADALTGERGDPALKVLAMSRSLADVNRALARVVPANSEGGDHD